jgi:Protein of unknown function (DUF992)
MKTLMTVASAILLVLGLASAANATARVGELRCHVRGGDGLVLGSSHKVRCIYYGAGGVRERYWGRINRVGLDIGHTNGGVFVWAVLAPSALGPHALAGRYVGATADATLEVGGGANLLVGGNGGTISLQPLSLTHETGVALGVGASELKLH